MKKLTLMLGAITFIAIASCKGDAAKGNDPTDGHSMEANDSQSGDGTMPETPQAQDSTGMISPDSTQASPPTVTKPQ